MAEIDATLGEATAREAGAGARFLHTDVTDEASVKQMMVQRAREAFGHVERAAELRRVAPSARTGQLPKLILRSGTAP